LTIAGTQKLTDGWMLRQTLTIGRLALGPIQMH